MINDYHNLHIVNSYLVLNSFYDIQKSKLYSHRTFEVAYLSSGRYITITKYRK